MRTTQLPWTRTLAFAQPPAVVAVPIEGGVLHEAPGMPDDALAHRLVLDAPPETVAPWLARWRAAHGDRGVEPAMLVWEGREHVVPPDASHVVRLRCLMADREVEPVEASGLRRLGPDDREAVIELLLREHPDSPPHRRWATWTVEQQLVRPDAAFFGVDGAEGLEAVAGVVWGRREARLQLVQTRAEARRRGHGAHVVQRAVQHYQEAIGFGITYAAAVEGSGTEAFLRALGFRRATAVTLVVEPP